MIKIFKKIGAIVGVTLLTTTAFGQANADCNTLDPICAGAGVQFSALSGVPAASVTNPGNAYNCLSSSPNPTWYYMQVGTSGPLVFSLTAPQDIDFIIYGPFSNLADAQAGCGSYGNGSTGGNVIDCSYSSTNNETPEIGPGSTGGATTATAGEVYVLLITNYANSLQNVDFNQTNAGAGGAGALDCNIIVVPPCVSEPGTFSLQKNGAVTTSPIYLCENETFGIISNGDYTLPSDTIPQSAGGDGIYSAQLLWLVYSAAPTTADPAADPAFLFFSIPSDDINDFNSGASPVVTAFGCGTYFFVPVAGDDGVGGNNNSASVPLNDNGSLHWDKDGNGCYLLGTAIEVTYACPITTTNSINCNPPTTTNGIDIQITGGDGGYTIINQGAGNLASTSVGNGGTATVADLTNNDTWSIDIVDSQGCSVNASGVFSAPVITSVVISPASTCPGGTPGQVDVIVAGTSGQGAPYAIVMAGDPPTVGTTDSYTNVAGTIVPIVVSDQAGCISDTTVTITSLGNYVDVQITSIQGENCYGDGTGAATISATPVDQFGNPNGNTVVSIVWTNPIGAQVGNTAASHLSESAMMPGVWVVCVTDNTTPAGCEVCIPVEITAPQQLDAFLDNSNDPTCYGGSDGSIGIGVTGGSGAITYSWSHDGTVTTDVANTLTLGVFTAYVTDANGCIDSVNVTLGQPDSLWAEFIVKDIDCFGDSTGGIIVTDVHGNQGNFYYFWNLQGVVPNPTNDINSANGLPIGTYLLTINDSLGCTNQWEWTLTQNTAIDTFTFGFRPSQCRTQPYQNGLGAVYVSAIGGVPAYSYLWTNLETGATSTNSTWGGINSADYQILVTDDLGCEYTNTIHLDSITPVASFTIFSDQLDANCEGTAPVSVQFTNTSTTFSNEYDPSSDTSFFWHLNWEAEVINGGAAGYHTDSWYEQMDTTYTGEHIYEVCLVVINDYDCKDTACKEIIVHDQPIFVPANVFTPGNSGENDVFQFFDKAQAVETFNAIIVDRWGKEVIQFNSITDGWNGDNKNGRPCNDGVYFYTYTIIFTNGDTDAGQGNITLIREQ